MNFLLSRSFQERSEHVFIRIHNKRKLWIIKVEAVQKPESPAKITKTTKSRKKAKENSHTQS